jgi:hypothetical protein
MNSQITEWISFSLQSRLKRMSQNIRFAHLYFCHDQYIFHLRAGTTAQRGLYSLNARKRAQVEAIFVIHYSIQYHVSQGRSVFEAHENHSPYPNVFCEFKYATIKAI